MRDKVEPTRLNAPGAHGAEVATRDNPDYFVRLITEQAASEILGVEVKTLQAWRVRGGGPAFVRLSARAVRYQRQTLLAWIASRRHASTSEYAS